MLDWRWRRRLAASGSMGRPARRRTRLPISWGVAADEAELAAELLLSVSHVTRTPPPLPVREGCGYKPCRIMRMWILPSIKFVFLKDLSLNSSSHCSYERVLPPSSGDKTKKSHREGGFLSSAICDWNCVSF